MFEAALLGFIQGVIEWLPVSSEGVVTAVHTLAFDSSVSEAVAFSLWLHLGTVLSVLAALRGEIVQATKDAVASPLKPTRFVAFLAVGTLVSGAVGFPLLLGLDELSDRIGAVAMGIVGVLMLVTGGIQLRRSDSGVRTRDDAGVTDAALTGIAQGFAALPGLSRSGLTVAVLLARNVDRREALVLSFLLSVPASLGAGLYAALSDDVVMSSSAVVAVVVAAVVGFVTIRALMSVAERVNFAYFVIAVGVSIVAGAVWQGLR
jgi:undecaprenyl-diphosphatase